MAIPKEKRLRELLEEIGGGEMAIVLRNDPNLDSIASGIALKLYVKAFGIDADMIYGGLMGRRSRALVNLLELNPLHVRGIDFSNYRSFAMADVATQADCALPREILPTIVIDHHSVPRDQIRTRYQDVWFVGATSTILVNYLQCATVEMDGATATALVMGILTGTMNFTQGATPLDLHAFESIVEFADPGLISRLLSLAISADALNAFANAIRAGKFRGGYYPF